MIPMKQVVKTLHDQVGGPLTAAGVQLELLRMDYQTKAPDVAERAVKIQGLLEEAMSEVRALTRNMREQP